MITLVKLFNCSVMTFYYYHHHYDVVTNIITIIITIIITMISLQEVDSVSSWAFVAFFRYLAL